MRRPARGAAARQLTDAPEPNLKIYTRRVSLNSFTGRKNDEPERYMLNMRFPPQSCLIVFGCSERVGFHFVGGGGKDFY